MKWKNLLSNAAIHFGNELPQSAYSNTILEATPLPFLNYYFIFDCVGGKIEHVSEQLTEVLGYSSETFTIEFLFEIIHPDDKDFFILHETRALEFCKQLDSEKQQKYKVVHDYRLKTRDGIYLRVLQQAYTYEMKNGLIQKTLVVHSDITHIKRDSTPELHIIGWGGEPSFYNVEVVDIPSAQGIKLSNRELEIARMIDQGMTSKKIANTLHISYHTVSNHRKNLMKKTQSTSFIAMLQRLKETGLL